MIPPFIFNIRIQPYPILMVTRGDLLDMDFSLSDIIVIFTVDQ